MSETSARTSIPRWILILLMSLGSIIVGGLAGLLTYAAEPSVPQSILSGAAAFAGAFALFLAIAIFAGSGSKQDA